MWSQYMKTSLTEACSVWQQQASATASCYTAPHRTAPMAGVPVPAQSQQRVTCYRTLKQTANRTDGVHHANFSATEHQRNTPVQYALLENRPNQAQTSDTASLQFPGTAHAWASQPVNCYHVRTFWRRWHDVWQRAGTKCGIFRATSLNAISPIGIHVRCTVLGSVCLCLSATFMHCA